MKTILTLLMLTLPLSACAHKGGHKDTKDVPACNVACVADYCEARCQGGTPKTSSELRECKANCAAYVTHEGACYPCKD